MKSLGFYLGQIPQLALAPVGWIILAVPCALGAYGDHGVKSNKVWPPPYEHYNGRPIDTWDWQWLNAWFGNPEDGVSGQNALVWGDGVNAPYGQLYIYNATGSRWKAYCWSAWRNSVDALKYVFPQS
jgi:hypothetical protein